MIDGVTHDKKLNCSQCQNKAQEESVRQCAGCCCAVARSGGQSRRGERAAAVPGRDTAVGGRAWPRPERGHAVTRDREDSEDRETQSDTVNTMSAALTAAVVVLASLATCDTAASVAEVTAAASSSASLPCNMTSSAAGDSVRLVLWFRGDMMTPVYSLDSRGELLVCF